MYIVITGTSRGIGLALTQLALSKGHHVLAIARKPDESDALQELKKRYQELELMSLDVMDKDAHLKIKKRLSTWPLVDAVINNAGIYEEDGRIENFEKSFLTNSIMPLFITKALLEELKKSQRAVSLQITSQMGSIEDNSSGGSYCYRASKAALNMLFKSLAVDEKWLISLLVHPGWVQTRMGGNSAPISPETSVEGIWKIFENAEPMQSGTFMNYEGKTLPW